LPITKSLSKRRRRRDLDSEDLFADDFFSSDSVNASVYEVKNDDPYYDSFLTIPDDIYCSFVESLDQACWQISPLELWGFDRSTIKNLTHEEIVDAVNNVKVRYKCQLIDIDID
jgi:hypothetical protein